MRRWRRKENNINEKEEEEGKTIEIRRRRETIEIRRRRGREKQ